MGILFDALLSVRCQHRFNDQVHPMKPVKDHRCAYRRSCAEWAELDDLSGILASKVGGQWLGAIYH